jgi:hypothetical protein
LLANFEPGLRKSLDSLDQSGTCSPIFNFVEPVEKYEAFPSGYRSLDYCPWHPEAHVTRDVAAELLGEVESRWLLGQHTQMLSEAS